MDMVIIEDLTLHCTEPLGFLQLHVALEVQSPITLTTLSSHDNVLDPESLQIFLEKRFKLIYSVPGETDILNEGILGFLVSHNKLFMKK